MYKLENCEGAQGVVVVFLIDEEAAGGPRVLLGRGVQGKKIGAGLLNGVGGFVDIGETPLHAMVRETAEEIGVKIREEDIWTGSHILCTVFARPFDKKLLHIGIVTKWQGKPKIVCREFEQLEWHPVNELPIGDMIEGDSLWIEQVLRHRLGVRGEIKHNKVERGGRKELTLNANDLTFYTTIECEKRRE